MEITVKNLQKKVRLNSPQITQITKTILKLQGIRKGSLTIVFVTRQKIQSLNQKFLKRRYATDVLAFPGCVPDLIRRRVLNLRPCITQFGTRVPNSKLGTQIICGDIVISTDAAIQNAKAYHLDVKREMILYVIHGILHLLGYDDHAPVDIRRMRPRCPFFSPIGYGN